MDCLHYVCNYLGISLDGVPLDATRSLDKLLTHIFVIEAYGVQNAAKIKALQERTNSKE